MPASFAAVVLSTPSPPELAAFYRELLGWVVVEVAEDWARLRHPERERPGLSFQLEPDFAAADWPARPGGVQMQSHLDVQVDDLDVETARAIALGATKADEQFQDDIRVLRDPHGHVFCLFLSGA